MVEILKLEEGDEYIYPLKIMNILLATFVKLYYHFIKF